MPAAGLRYGGFGMSAIDAGCRLWLAVAVRPVRHPAIVAAR
ncbi:hypothetical protein [Ralstonia pseudosolanacearum]|nr:hypothetical protein [Ralstonia pseudosolanacearum]